MRVGRVALLVLVLGLAFQACLFSGPRFPTPDRMSPEQKVEATRRIVEWLECEECIDGELRAVLEVGEGAVPSLARALLDGPSPAALALLRADLRQRHGELSAFARRHPEASFDMTADQYVEHYASNYVALYQVRSARGLSEIGGPAAIRALREALAGDFLREDARDAVQRALDRAERPWWWPFGRRSG